VNARRFDPARSEKALERQLYDLLGFAHDIGPAPLREQHIEGTQSYLGSVHVVERELTIPHDQATSVQ
jgi:hypothetical protein